jgi:hypothetical protein
MKGLIYLFYRLTLRTFKQAITFKSHKKPFFVIMLYIM